jgi:hypothetical protein
VHKAVKKIQSHSVADTSKLYCLAALTNAEPYRFQQEKSPEIMGLAQLRCLNFWSTVALVAVSPSIGKFDSHTVAPPHCTGSTIPHHLIDRVCTPNVFLLFFGIHVGYLYISFILHLLD